MNELVGLDVGGTKVVAARVCDGRLGPSRTQPTQRSSPGALIDQMVGLIESVRSGEVSAVGIGMPSVVEFATGRVLSSVNVPLADVPLRHVIGARLGVPVFVDNDATVAALAEAHDEQLRPVAKSLVMITIGTGVGGGLVLGGRIYRGATGGAGELGHTIVALDLARATPVPAATHFPQPPSLESLASGRALDRLAADAASRYPESSLGRLKASGQAVLGSEAVQAARDGDVAAARVVEIWGRRVGIGIANAINTFDPEEIVIGGGAAMAARELMLGPATRVALGYVLPGVGTRTTIRIARHGVRAGVLGAALLAMHESEHLHQDPDGINGSLLTGTRVGPGVC